MKLLILVALVVLVVLAFAAPALAAPVNGAAFGEWVSSSAQAGGFHWGLHTVAASAPVNDDFHARLFIY